MRPTPDRPAGGDPTHARVTLPPAPATGAENSRPGQRPRRHAATFTGCVCVNRGRDERQRPPTAGEQPRRHMTAATGNGSRHVTGSAASPRAGLSRPGLGPWCGVPVASPRARHTRQQLPKSCGSADNLLTGQRSVECPGSPSTLQKKRRQQQQQR